jgi:hypothetical protein
MRAAYRVLAALIALEVIVQGASMALGTASLVAWVDEGNTFDKALLESDNAEFDGLTALIVHGINGMMIIPLLALLLLIVSFFAKVPKGVMWAGLVLLFVVIQVGLGLLGHEQPIFGGIHGGNALLLFGVAVMAFMKAKTPVTTSEPPERAEHRATV